MLTAYWIGVVVCVFPLIWLAYNTGDINRPVQMSIAIGIAVALVWPLQIAIMLIGALVTPKDN